jgi:NAD(P)-dependent dehydrogenase (short-subunit alcohol dehydrogenase family)
MKELDGKVCVITGGALGIGAAISSSLAGAGGRIVLLDNNEEAATAMAAHLLDAGTEAVVHCADVRDAEGVEAAAQAVHEELGSVDVLINNAGISQLGPTLDFPLADWETSIGVMQTGVFLCSAAFGRVMRETGGGSIVSISSINGLTAFPGRLAYSAAKAAVVSMTQVLAVEWASYGIRVNAIAPGVNDTPMLHEAVEAGLIDPDKYLSHIPMGRFAQPSEMAEPVLFLASERSSYITGQTIAVDGGWTSFGWVPWDGDPAAQPSVGLGKYRYEGVRNA